MSAGIRQPWVIMSSYPAWSSPYFTELSRHAPAELNLEFAADLDILVHRQGPVGVINLHRLKRLYRTDGTPTPAAAEAMLEQLAMLRRRGWKLVWTVHNLLPIDGSPPGEADRRAVYGVLRLADMVLTHTRADADHLSHLTDAPVAVTGWGGITRSGSAATTVPRQVAELAARIGRSPMSMLLLGNLAPYKDACGIIEAVTRRSRSLQLFIVGTCPDEGAARTLVAQAADSGDRVHVHLDRVAPEHAHFLYRGADAALCPYRAAGRWEYFSRVLYPGSVATAVDFATPVIAPDLPSVREITSSHPRLLYPPAEGPSAVLPAVEGRAWETKREPRGTRKQGWDAVMSGYLNIAKDLLAGPTARR